MFMDKRNKDINEYLIEEATNTTEIAGVTLFEIVYTFLPLLPFDFYFNFCLRYFVDISTHAGVEIVFCHLFSLD